MPVITKWISRKPGTLATVFDTGDGVLAGMILKWAWL
jgi:hypothetical protein